MVTEMLIMMRPYSTTTIKLLLTCNNYITACKSIVCTDNRCLVEITGQIHADGNHRHTLGIDVGRDLIIEHGAILILDVTQLKVLSMILESDQRNTIDPKRSIVVRKGVGRVSLVVHAERITHMNALLQVQTETGWVEISTHPVL